MTLLHKLNILVHVLFGTVALVIGLIALVNQNRPSRHIRFGRYFLYLLSVVVGTAFLGTIFFRSTPFLLMLTLLSGYGSYSGYRTVRRRERPATPIDVLIAVGVLLTGVLYLAHVQLSDRNWSPAVVYPTLSALVLMTGYDIVKHVWFFERLRTWWLYEHIYKMCSAYNAIVSAFTGTVLPQFKPYSQILPTVLCLWVITYFIWKRATVQKQRRQVMHPSLQT
ncbi:hypothetical protein GCM10023189_58030 [Nibrella saemangeumensis]|uniref:DUF2306 domain-containing protein n=1 Tax=Nibrella saemangeumensis TaxID=1084526 RepID=A0ABP8NNJ5_9BACT